MTTALLTTIAGFALVLLTVALVPLVAARLRLPAATLQASVGLVLGMVALLVPETGHPPLAESLLQPLDALERTLAALGAQGVLAIFLPPLLFDAALRVDTRQLMADLAPVLVLAVVAVLLTTATVAAGVVAVTDLPWLWAVLLGALVATTDPSAVLGAFREVGAPRRLQSLVEGESLLNDAAAIVLFAAVVDVLAGSAPLAATEMGRDFLLTFMGGGAVGGALGWLAGRVVARLREAPDVAITVSLALPYLAFAGAELHLGVSGVVAVVVAGLALGKALDESVAPALSAQVMQLWSQLANWSGAFIVIGATLLIPVTLRFEAFEVDALLAVVLGCFLARGVVVSGLLPALTAAGLAAPVHRPFRVAMLWGGLRGAVTVALALTIAADATLPLALREKVALLACALVLITLFVQAPTLPALLRALGLGGLSRLDAVLRDRASRAVGARLAERVTSLRVELGLDVPDVGDMALAAPRPAPETDRRDRIVAALASISEREAEHYREHYDEGIVGPRIAPALLRGPRLLTEALRARGLAAYATAAKQELAYGRGLRLALTVYRRLGWRRPVSRALALRYELVLIRRAVLIRLRRTAVDELATIIDADAATRVDTLLDARLVGHQTALEGLRRQYPAYARELEGRFLRRAALRLEALAYRELYQDGLLSGAAYGDLRRRVQRVVRRTEPLPTIDLRVDRAALLDRVALFSELDAATRRRLRRALRPGLAVPGDRLIRRGEAGDALYLIADGAVSVRWPDGRRTLGTGDIFGEAALVTRERRTADVVALTYVRYLRLARDDFLRLAWPNEALRSAVAALAEQRAQERRQAAVSRETDAASP